MKIIKKPSDQQLWVVRAQSGNYVQNFLLGKVVAIGHIDHLRLSESKVFHPEADELLQLMMSHMNKEDRSSKRHIQNHYNQVMRFIYEMKIGDLVLCPSSNSVRVGRIVGSAFLSKNPIEYVTDVDRNTKVTMRSNLRRNVEWGPTIERKEFSYKVNKALTANQAVFSLNEHWQYVYHALYACFIDGDTFHFSIKIRQKNDIDNYSVSQLLSYLSEVEAASILYDKIDVNNGTHFNKSFFDLRVNKSLQLRTKAQFMSEGDIFANIPTLLASSKGLVWFVLGYSMIFGNAKLGFDGLIDTETKKKIYQFVADRWINKGGEQVQKMLELDQPKNKTLALEDHSKDAEKQREPVTYIDLKDLFNKQQDEAPDA